MPDEPYAQAPLSQREPHQERELAESFGFDPERYDRSRPRYPDAMVNRIVASSPGLDVLDVGVGTGIAARQFRAAGCRILGIDADARMAEFARRSGIQVEVARFEDWDRAGRSFDVIIAGQTWHWVDPIVGGAKAADALRPAGRLAIFWNAGQPPPELAEAFAAIYRELVPDSLAVRPWRANSSSPDAYAKLCKTAADGMIRSGAFSEPEHWRLPPDPALRSRRYKLLGWPYQ
jgi:SAM-dependent methyltransferase